MKGNHDGVYVFDKLELVKYTFDINKLRIKEEEFSKITELYENSVCTIRGVSETKEKRILIEDQNGNIYWKNT